MQANQSSQPNSLSGAESTTLIGAAALLASCSADGERHEFLDALAEGHAAPTRRILAGSEEAGQGGSVPTPTELMDWAERTYPQFFPSVQPNVIAPPYVYRHYAQTGNYVGVAGTDVYVLGPVSGGALLRVGSLADFAPQVLATRYAFSDQAAARFLLQAQFAATDADIALVRHLGYPGWLQAQFALPVGESAWDWLMSRGYGVADEQMYYDGGAPAFDFAAYKQMLSAPDALRCRIQQALTEYFVVSLTSVLLPWSHLLYATFWDRLGDHAFGNFRDLLEQVTLSAAMGAYLNTATSQKEDPVTGRLPDENYAREVMQLFTIGLYQLNDDGSQRLDAAGKPIETYTASDVSQLARVFTGYEVDFSGPSVPALVGGRPIPLAPYSQRPMRLNVDQHSFLEARFLGAVVPANTPASKAMQIALDALFNHANVGPFFGRQLIQRLVTSNPSPAYVMRVSAAFNDNGQGTRGDMKAVISAVLLDEEARSDAGLSSSTFGKLREPALRFVQWGRTFGMTSRAGSWKFGFDYANPDLFFGQRLFWSPTVFNFFRPGFVPPGTALAASHSTAPELQIISETTVAQYLNCLQGWVFDGPWINAPERADWDPNVPSARSGVGDMVADYSREIAIAHDLPVLLSRLNLLLCAGQLSERTRTKLVAALATFPVTSASDERTRHGRVAQAVLMIMSCPEYLVQK